MNGSKVFLIFWSLFIFHSNILCYGSNPNTEDLSMFEDESEWKQILAQLQDLESFVKSPSRSIGALDTRAKDIENHIEAAGIQTNEKMDAIQKQIEELHSKFLVEDGPKSGDMERMGAPKSGVMKKVEVSCNENLNVVNQNLKVPFEKLQAEVSALLQQSRTDDARTEAEQKIVTDSLLALKNAWDGLETHVSNKEKRDTYATYLGIIISSYGHRCHSPCVHSKEMSGNACKTIINKVEGLDYCATRAGLDYRNNECTNSCAYRNERYKWCYIKGGSWGYC